MYYILLDELSDSEQAAILEGEYGDLETEDFPFDEGTAIPKPGFDLPVEFSLYINVLRGVMTDKLSVENIAGVVFSEKVKGFLVEQGLNNIEFYPMQITDKFSNLEEVQKAEFQDKKINYQSKIYDNYYIANIVGLVDCVDHAASELEYFSPRLTIPEDMPDNMKATLTQEEDNDIDFIYKLVLDESKISTDLQIFRLKDCPRIIVFKEEIVNAIREAQLTGFVFIPLTEYTDEIPDEEEDETVGSSEDKATPAPVQPDKKQSEEVPLPKIGGGIVIKSIRRND